MLNLWDFLILVGSRSHPRSAWELCIKKIERLSTVYTFTCGGIHRDGTIVIRGTCTCRGLHRPNTISVCYPALVVMYIATASSVYVSPSPIEEHIAPTQAMSYVEEFYESSSHVRRRLLATKCGEQCSPVSLFVDTFYSCYKVSLTKLTHRQLLCSPRTVGMAPHQGACADLEMKKKKKRHGIAPWTLGRASPVV